MYEYIIIINKLWTYHCLFPACYIINLVTYHIAYKYKKTYIQNLSINDTLFVNNMKHIQKTKQKRN